MTSPTNPDPAGTAMDTYDVVVIGAGPVGENVADYAVRGGLSAAIVETELAGGECSYWACMPSKALLRSGEARRAALSVDGARQAVTGDVDVAAVLQRRTSFTSNWDDSGQVEWLGSAGVDFVRGHGRLSAAKQVTVTDHDGGQRVLHARQAVAVCSGTRAFIPPIQGLREVAPWTNREATETDAVPASLVVIGGGAVGTELAGAFADLGSTVTMVVRDRLLSGYEDFAADLVGSALAGRGVDIRTGTSATSVRRDGDDVVVQCDDGRTVVAEQILVATGREPRTDQIGLDAVGLSGADLEVDESMRVRGTDGQALDWLYAVGDINQRAAVTHQGKYQARIAGAAMAARAKGQRVDDSPWGTHAATADHRAATQVVFTDPQVASVGLTSSQARDADMRVRVIDQDIGGVAGAAVHADGYTGTARMIVDEDRHVLIGVTFVGPGVAELLHAASIAITGEVPLARLWHAVPAFPTISEVWLRLLEAYTADDE